MRSIRRAVQIAVITPAFVVGAALMGAAAPPGCQSNTTAATTANVISSSNGNEQLANRMAADAGWDSAGQQCLDNVESREDSTWSVTATNPSSGAYGIPQALPAGKMASAGSDWRWNPRTQIRWMIRYIDERYGGPCAAWDHEQADNWY
jgi:hypothetical protein